MNARDRSRRALLDRYPFQLDRFQLDACDALDAGDHVVVAAPTGSGKTVVAEYAVAVARSAGRRAFYTAPIKALSNQKFRDLTEMHGEEHVGLLTGDNSIRPEAPIVVMTTEVLRNMIYTGRALDDLAVVVLDEVHFLQDTYRGPVWEEVIVHLPHHIRLVCLSATVSNSSELAEWIATVRGPTTPVVEHRRPIELESWYLVGDRTDDRLRMLSMFSGGRANPDAERLDAAADRPGPRGANRGGRRSDRGERRRLYTPGRVETVRLLARRDLLPAIVFIFSRNQCDDAADECLRAGLDLLTDDERDRVRAIAEARLGHLGDADLAVLGHERFLRLLEAGVVAHHAGMVPPFKEVVEACFSEGLTKVVFATETLAVGINMPARTVVIEKLSKFTGDHHELLTPGQFTQLTGRAGRRGIDDRGHAVVSWSPFVRFERVVELASSRSFHLRSAFRPTYNMAANLVRTYSADAARHLLDLSFAQFQADRDVVRIEARLDHLRPRLAELRAESTSPYGDLEEFRRSRKLPRAGADRGGVADPTDPIEVALAELRPGDVIRIDHGKHRAPAVVVANAHRRGGVRLTVVTPAAATVRLGAADFDVPPRPIGSVRLPRDHAPDRPDYRRTVAGRLRTATLAEAGDVTGRRARRASARTSSIEVHPVEADPDLRARLRAADRADRVGREIAELERRAAGHHHSLSDEFDRVLGVLAARGYVDPDAWRLTADGEILARVFHECDLLVSDCLRRGMLDGVTAPELAGLVSMFVYEHRSPEPPPSPWFPSGQIADLAGRVVAASDDLARMEAAAGVPVHRAPDPTFLAIAHAWVAGEGFAEVVADDDMTGGDFVRTMKQLIDLLRQIATTAPSSATRRTARAAVESAHRGVVADSSLPGSGSAVEEPPS